MTALAAALVAVLLISLVAIVAAFLVARDRAEQRHAQERVADREERQLLLNRIQAPEVAVAQVLQAAPGVTALDPGSDAAWWEHVNEGQPVA